jgi:hypothetical protein
VNLKPGAIIPAVVAIAILALTLQYTRSALQTSGAWRSPARSAVVDSGDSYSRIDQILARPSFQQDAVPTRNPFAYGQAPKPEVVAHATTVRRAPPPAPVLPQLTAILWDADPRALIRYDGRDYTVRENSLFAEFRVASITQSNVTLERNGSPIVLSLRPRGE